MSGYSLDDYYNYYYNNYYNGNDDNSDFDQANTTGMHEHHVSHDEHAGHGAAHPESHAIAGGHDMHSMAMQMYFYFSCKCVILFKEWDVDTAGEMFGSCVAVFIMAALYEGLKVAREYLLVKAHSKQRIDKYKNVAVASNGQNGDTSMTLEQPLDPHAADTRQPTSAVSARMLSLAHLIQSLLHILQVVLSYMLMLIFMTYNGWLCIAVALGAGFGYFLFGWKRQSVIDNNEHCH